MKENGGEKLGNLNFEMEFFHAVLWLAGWLITEGFVKLKESRLAHDP